MYERLLLIFLSACLSQSLAAIAIAEVPCASAEQIEKIKDVVAKSPAALPNILAERSGIPEAVVVTGLDTQAAIGTTGDAFTKVWSSLTGWERPAFLIPVDKSNTLEVFGRIGPTIKEKDGSVLIEVAGAGIGGHFKPASIASIFMIRIANGEKQTVYGMLFFNAQSETLFGIYSVDAPRPAVIALLSRDAYQKTWDLIAEMPRVCAR